jgi:hypothetical protein
MFNLFRKKQKEIQEFPDNVTAFAHACTLGYEPLIGGLMPALVQEEGELGTAGERTFLISLAVEGAPSFWTCTLKESKAYPKPGDFIGFRIVTIASDLPEYVNLIGYIACRLQTVLVPGRGWRVAESYTPANIKQDIHL